MRYLEEFFKRKNLIQFTEFLFQSGSGNKK